MTGYQNRPKPVDLQIAYWNVRCLGDDWKRELALRVLIDALDAEPDIILLSETKC
jgi:hypothetical protein